MYIAAPSKKDIEAAHRFYSILQDVFDAQIMPDTGDENEDQFFYPGDADCLKILYEKLEEIYRHPPSWLPRIVDGMEAIMNSDFFVKDSDHLALKCPEKKKFVDAE